MDAAYAIVFVMGAALGFIGGVLYSEWNRAGARRTRLKYHEEQPSELFREGE